MTTRHNRNHDLTKKLTPARLRIDHKQALSPGGIYRDTVVFSIINQEWPAVRQNLRYLLERGGG
jgi:RimJ/RimL family protein N-acetyltransferase